MAGQGVKCKVACFAHQTCAVLLDMDIVKMLADLRDQPEANEQAIIVLERIAAGQGKRRGRPPAWMAATKRAKWL